MEIVLEKNGVVIVQTQKMDGNLALHTGEDEEMVLGNRARLPLPASPFWLNQTHSARVTQTHDFSPNADAAVSVQPNEVLAILTADCLPILLFGKKTIAAIHAGWRGLAGGIVENTLGQINEAPTDLHVWMGPAIGACCFEVGEEVKNAFLDYENAFSTVNPKKFQGDLKKIAQMKLEKAGVLPQQIENYNVCTACDGRFFSYRLNQTTGRMASFIFRKSFA